MKTFLLTMGGKEYGWSRHNDENIFRDYDAEADRLLASGKNFGLIPVKFDNEFISDWSASNNGYEETLSKPGFGFAFKAIGFSEMLKAMKDDDMALWVDSNHVVRNNPKPFFDVLNIPSSKGILARDHIWVYYPNKQWTKRDTFINMGCDEEKYWNAPQMHCCIMGVRKCEFSVKFFEEYLKYCLDWRVTFGEGKHENFPEFKENRHNQSVFSIMIRKYEIPYVNRTSVVWAEDIIPEIDFIRASNPIDNSHRKEQDRKDIR